MPINDADCAHVGRSRHVRVCAQSLGDRTVAVDRGPWLFATFLLSATTLQLIFVDVQGQSALAHVDGDWVAILDQTDNSAVSSLRGDVADGQTRGTTGEAAVGDQGTCLAQTGALEEGSRVHHLLHARAASRTLIADDDDIASLDFALQNDGDCFFLGLDNASRALEVPQVFFDTSGLNDGAIRCEVAAQDNQTTLVGVGEFCGVDAAVFLVGVESLPDVVSGKWLGGAYAAWGCQEEIACLFQFLAAANIPVIQPFAGVFVQRGVNIHLQVTGAAQLTQDGRDTTGAVDIFDVPDAVGSNLGQTRNGVRDFLDVVQREVDGTFLCCSQGVQDGVGGTTHCHVQSHGVVESVLVGDIAWQDGFIFFAVVATAQVHDGGAGLLEKTAAERVGCQGGAVARQR